MSVRSGRLSGGVVHVGVLPGAGLPDDGGATRLRVPRGARHADGLVAGALRAAGSAPVVLENLQWVDDGSVEEVLAGGRVEAVSLATALDDRDLLGRAAGLEWRVERVGSPESVATCDLEAAATSAGGDVASLAALHLACPLAEPPPGVSVRLCEPDGRLWRVPPALGEWALERAGGPTEAMWSAAAELADDPARRADLLARAGDPSAPAVAAAALDGGCAPDDAVAHLRLRWVAAALAEDERSERVTLARRGLDLDEDLAEEWLAQLAGGHPVEVLRAELLRRRADPGADRLLDTATGPTAARLRSARAAWPGLVGDASAQDEGAGALREWGAWFSSPDADLATAPWEDAPVDWYLLCTLGRAWSAPDDPCAPPDGVPATRVDAVRALGEVLDRWRAGAVASAVDALAALGPSGPSVGAPVLLRCLHAVGVADLGRGREGRAALGDPPAAPGELALWAWALAECELSASRPAAARAALAGLSPQVEHTRLAAPAALVGAWACRDLGEAPDHGPQLPGRADDAELRGVLALDADPAGAVFHFSASLDAGRCAARDRVRRAWALGEALRASGDTDAAVQRLQEVHSEALAAGFAPIVARARRSLRAAGVRLRSSGRAEGALSAREREVLTLVGQGAASAEIAVRLGVARSTVETQVASAMAKLGVRSRVHAAAMVASGSATQLTGGGS